MSEQHGWSALEVLVILAVVAAIAAFAFRITGASVVFAKVYADGVRTARLHAVVSADVVSLNERACPGVETIQPPIDARTRVVSFPSRGLLFTPDGLPRTCDGGGVGNTTILLEHRGRQAAVIVSSLGRVRWELR